MIYQRVSWLSATRIVSCAIDNLPLEFRARERTSGGCSVCKIELLRSGGLWVDNCATAVGHV